MKELRPNRIERYCITEDPLNLHEVTNYCYKKCETCKVRFLCFSVEAGAIDIFYVDNEIALVFYLVDDVWHITYSSY